jgi:hypothetical protein
MRELDGTTSGGRISVADLDCPDCPSQCDWDELESLGEIVAVAAFPCAKAMQE